MTLEWMRFLLAPWNSSPDWTRTDTRISKLYPIGLTSIFKPTADDGDFDHHSSFDLVLSSYFSHQYRISRLSTGEIVGKGLVK